MTTDPKQNTLIRVEDVKMHFKKGEIKAREVGAKPLSSYTGLLDSLLG